MQFVTSLIEGVIRISIQEALCARQIRAQGQEFVPKLLDPDLKVSGGREVSPECLEDENLQCLDYCPLSRVLGLRLYIFDKSWGPSEIELVSGTEPANIRMHLTGYKRALPLPLASDAGG